MKMIDDEFVTSATDLATYMGCQHATHLDARSAAGEISRLYYDNPELDALKLRGEAHEQAYLKHLKQKGKRGVALDRDASPDALLQAMQAGADYIYQAYLQHDTWRGYADFLIKVDRPSRLGNWSYEVLDAKLALETRGETILQLCVYSELLAALQGLHPENAYVLTPGEFAPERYRLAEYSAYYRLVKRDFLEYLPGARQHKSYPEPCDKCERCDWYANCEQRWRDDDHLTFVAGIQRSQRVELGEHKVSTLKSLAKLPLPIAFNPQRGSAESLARVREQARVQLKARESGKLVHEILSPEPDQGVYLLPTPSRGDVFFDIEGARFVGDTGFEYLFGFATRDSRGKITYEQLLANNPADERRIFDEFMQRMAAILAQDPKMHIYHFHSYEPSALKRLACRYALHEELLDDFLRFDRFVDLHGVVRHTLRAGIERYSIKDLEPFFGYQRAMDLRTAGDARHQLENLLEFNCPMAEAPTEQVRIVVEYNKDDCLATRGLRDWLEAIRKDLNRQGAKIPRPVPNPPATEELRENPARLRNLGESLRKGLPELEAGYSADDRARWLLSHLLEFYRREDKATWWEYFRLDALDDVARLDEKAAIAGLKRIKTIAQSAQGIPTDRYAFPTQDLALKAGDSLHNDGVAWGTVDAIDLSRNTIDIKKRKDSAGIDATSAFVHSRVRKDVLVNSLIAIAERVIGGDDTGAAMALLRRDLPRLTRRRKFLSRRQDFSSELDLATTVVNELKDAVLGIQGPPGTGKTYTGAHMILAAIEAGKTVGVTAQSHKVIANLMKATTRLARERGIEIDAVRNPGDADVPPEDEDEMIQLTGNQGVSAAIKRGAQFVGGTAWLWAREEMVASVDLLFIDEAGQFSLANTCAVARAAPSLVLLGDPQQLDQPLQGTHPHGVEVSCLQHLLGDAKTMPPERGIFLPESWRMHPGISGYISEMFYEGKLTSQADRVNNRLVHPDFKPGAGLWFAPVKHLGNQNASIEEAKAVKKLVTRLLDGGKWVDHQKKRRPLTLDDILIVTPYNSQVSEIAKRLPRARIGTVDKFQGQEAPVVIISYATSTPEDAPRGMEFLYSLNRLNVAASRAKCAVIMSCAPALVKPECKMPRHMKLANGLARYVEVAREKAP
ncbi:MAG: TM0106 family RecB-like putative nuclease [Pseudomonadota bacterium]